ncbi:MAG: hypothetical protein U1E39_13270 [Planctomycetota bacterium]
MQPAPRAGLIVLGAAMAVYGAACLTGGWLGMPPWWERSVRFEYRPTGPSGTGDAAQRASANRGGINARARSNGDESPEGATVRLEAVPTRVVEPRDLASYSVAFLGSLLLAIYALPRSWWLTLQDFALAEHRTDYPTLRFYVLGCVINFAMGALTMIALFGTFGSALILILETIRVLRHGV